MKDRSDFMKFHLTRRSLFASSLGTILAPHSLASAAYRPVNAPDFAKLQRYSGGRIGISARLGRTKHMVTFQSDASFPMCSTHKFFPLRLSCLWSTLESEICGSLFRSPLRTSCHMHR